MKAVTTRSSSVREMFFSARPRRNRGPDFSIVINDAPPPTGATGAKECVGRLGFGQGDFRHKKWL